MKFIIKNIITIILSVIIINVIFSYINLNFDLTNDKRYTISEESKKVLKNLDDKIYIKIYLDGNLPSEFEFFKNSMQTLLKNIRSVNSDLFEFDFNNPNINDEDKKITLFNQLIDLGLSPTDIQINKDDSKITQRIFPGAIVYYKDKTLAVNLLKNRANRSPSNSINHSIENLEYEIISSILKITKKENDKIAFLTGNGQLSAEHVYDISHSVMNDNYNLSNYYDVERFDIKEYIIDSLNNKNNIAFQISRLLKYKVVIIAKPTLAFNDLDKYIIDQYIMNGGKVLWLVDGVKANMDSLKTQGGSFIAMKNNLNIDDQLFKYGVRINANLIQDLRSAQIPIVTGYSNNIPQQNFFTWPYYPILYSQKKHSLSKNIDGVKCEFVSSIDLIKNNVKKTILLESSENSRLTLSPSDISLEILRNPPPKSSFSQGRKTIAVLLEGKFESVYKNRILPKDNLILNFKESSIENKMIVISDGDIISNYVSKAGNIYPLGYDKYRKVTEAYPGNKYFLINLVQFLNDNQQLNLIKSKNLSLRMLDKKKIKKNRLTIEIINIILPVVLLSLFSIFFKLYETKKYA